MKTIHVGTISGRETLLNAAIGHQARQTGTGPHKNRKRDKKTRRSEDKRSAQEW